MEYFKPTKLKIFWFWLMASYKMFVSFNTICVVDVCFVIFMVYGGVQRDSDGSGQRSCKCNYVDFYKDARPPC